MGFWDNLFNTSKPREDNSEPYFDAIVSMSGIDTGMFVGSGALKNSDVFSAIRKIAGDIASNEIIYNDESNQGKRLVTLLNNKPNNNMNAWSFWFSLMGNALLYGNSYAEIEKNNSNQVTALKYLDNNLVEVLRDEDTGILTYVIDGKRRLTSDQILHFKVFTNDGVTGTSPIVALYDQISIQKSKNGLMDKFFKNGDIGKGLLTVKTADLGSQSKDTIRNKFDASMQKSSRTAILDENMQYQALPFDKSVVDIANNVDFTTREIAAAFGLPVEALGVENEHSNNQQSMLNYLQSTLTYYFKCITSELNFKLSSADYSFSFDTAKLFTADPQTMLTMYEGAIDSGIMTVNEVREKIGLPAINDGDQLNTKGTTMNE